MNRMTQIGKTCNQLKINNVQLVPVPLNFRVSETQSTHSFSMTTRLYDIEYMLYVCLSCFISIWFSSLFLSPRDHKLEKWEKPGKVFIRLRYEWNRENHTKQMVI